MLSSRLLSVNGYTIIVDYIEYVLTPSMADIQSTAIRHKRILGG